METYLGPKRFIIFCIISLTFSLCSVQKVNKFKWLFQDPGLPVISLMKMLALWREAEFEIAYSMNIEWTSNWLQTYLTSAKRIHTLLPNLVDYECDPPRLRYHVTYDVLTSATT